MYRGRKSIAILRPTRNATSVCVSRLLPRNRVGTCRVRMSDFHVSHVSPPWSGAGQMVRPPGVKPSRVGLSLVRRDQCEYGEGRRRIGHEHPAPGFALLPAVFAVKVERVCPPRMMHPLIDLDVLLMSP